MLIFFYSVLRLNKNYPAC